MISASVRLSIASSIKRRRAEDGRVGLQPGEPGPSSSSASSTPSVTSSVSAPGNFSTTSSRPSPSLTTASPISGWWSTVMLATSVEAQPSAGPLDRHLAELLRVRDLVEHVADLEPLLRSLDEAAGAGSRGLQEAQRRDHLRVARRLDDLAQRDVPVAQALRVDLHLELLVAHAPDRPRWPRRARPSGAA